MTKKRAQRTHAKRRAFERHQLEFTKDVRRHFLSHIQNSKGKFVESKSRRISVWEVDYDSTTYRVIYDKLRHEIVTFLPKRERSEDE